MIVEEFKNTGIMDKNKIFISDKDILLYKQGNGICIFEVGFDNGGAPTITSTQDGIQIVCLLTQEAALTLEIVDFMMN